MFSLENLKKAIGNFKEKELNTEAIKNCALEISIPQLNFTYSIAKGTATADNQSAMTTSHQFHIASITKTITASLILQLWEKGFFGSKGLDISLGELSIFPPEILNRLHNKENVNSGSKITLRQLLTHTSGLKDPYADDENGIATDYDEGIAPGSIAAAWQTDFEKLGSGDSSFNEQTAIIYKNWTPWDSTQPDNKEAGMVNYYINTLGNSPVASPSKIYHYSDTGFVILALIAEKFGKKSYHKLLRDNIFDPLGMNSTYLAYSNDPKPDKWEKEISDCYASDFPLVSGGFNFSFDWGGGGIVSTASDLNIFLRTLLKGNLFEKEETLKAMLNFENYSGLGLSGTKMGLGIFAERNKKTDAILWGHDGAWGSVMYYEPENNIYISGTVNQLLGVPSGWLNKLFNVVSETLKIT